MMMMMATITQTEKCTETVRETGTGPGKIPERDDDDGVGGIDR